MVSGKDIGPRKILGPGRYWGSPGDFDCIFLHGFWPDTINSVVPGGWSIAVEMTFYLLFPLLVLCVGSRKFIYLALSVLVWFVYAAFVRPLLSGLLGDDNLVRDFLFLNFINQAPVFLLGCYLYNVLKGGVEWIDVLALVLWCLFAFVMERFSIVEGVDFLYVYVVMGVCVYLCMKFSIKMRFLEQVGRRSYAMYLSHFIVLSVVARLMPEVDGVVVFLLAFFMVSLVAYIVAGILGRLVEDKVNFWVSQRLKATVGESVSVAGKKA